MLIEKTVIISPLASESAENRVLSLFCEAA